MASEELRIGVDWGGTKIEGIALDRRGRELARRRIATIHDDYLACVEAAVGLVRDLERDAGGIGTVGIGIPGSLSPVTGLARNGNMTWLNGQPLGVDFGRILGRSVKIENDANCFAVSEAVDGAAAGKRVVVGLIIGTGCGAGVAIDGAAQTGHNGIAGEVGHLPLPRMTPDEYPGRRCWCGRQGCLEVFISGTGFRADYVDATGEDISTKDIIARMRAGHPDARASFDRYCDRLARSLSMVAEVIDPDAFVLGGGMSNVDEIYTAVPPLLAATALTDTMTTPILKAVHGDSSGVRGAAWLWGR